MITNTVIRGRISSYNRPASRSSELGLKSLPYSQSEETAVRNVILRWTIWNATPFSIFMLCHSVETFRHFFGATPRYIVFADDPPVVDALRLCSFELVNLKDVSSSFADTRGNWRKWAPPRLDIRAVELRINSDIFLLAEPSEIRSFCEGRSGRQWLVTREEFSAQWPYGNFAHRLPTDFIPVNVGLVGQSEGCDISPDLQKFATARDRAAPLARTRMSNQ